MSAPLLDGYLVHVVARYGLSTQVPTLRMGELGFDTDTKTFRVGDDTSAPPRLMTTKSTGNFDFSTVTQIMLPGNTPVTNDGKIDGVDISSLNQSNGLLVRTGNGVFGNTLLVSGDATLLITNPTGAGVGGIDVRLNPNVTFIPDGDKGDIVVTNLGTQWNIDAGVVMNSHMYPMSIVGVKGSLTAGGAVSDLTPVQVAEMLPLYGTITKGVVPPFISVQGRVLSDSGWVAPGELFGRLDGKESVRCTATVNVNMAGTVVPIDDVNLASGVVTRVGLVGQTNAAQNGIYEVSVLGSSWTWVRSADANISEEVTAGMSFWSSEGTDNSDCVWYLTTNDPIVLNTTPLTFIKADYGANFVRKTGDTMTGTLYNNAAAGASRPGCFIGNLHATTVTDSFAFQGLVNAPGANSVGAMRGLAVAVSAPGAGYIQGILAYAGTYSFFGAGTLLNNGPLVLANSAQFGLGFVQFPDSTQQFTAFTADTYVRKTGDTMSGSLSIVGTPGTHSLYSQAGSAALSAVMGVSNNLAVYGTLGHANQYSFYGSGLLRNYNGHLSVGTLGYGVEFADGTIQYTAAKGIYARERWQHNGSTGMMMVASTLARPNPSFGLTQRISTFTFSGALNSLSNGPQPNFTATFAANMPNTNYEVIMTVVSQTGGTPENPTETYTYSMNLATKTVSGFTGTIPSVTGAIVSISVELVHYNA